jgi:CBS domain-containing protein
MRMAQAVREVMTKQPVLLQADETLTQAARRMRDQDIGDVLVMKDGKLKGIVTDRDIAIRAVADGKNPNETKVGDVCSGELLTIAADRPVAEAVDMMRKKAVRRLPVVEGDRPVGVLSLGDLAVERDPKSALSHISAAEPNK